MEHQATAAASLVAFYHCQCGKKNPFFLMEIYWWRKSALFLLFLLFETSNREKGGNIRGFQHEKCLTIDLEMLLHNKSLTSSKDLYV